MRTLQTYATHLFWVTIILNCYIAIVLAQSVKDREFEVPQEAWEHELEVGHAAGATVPLDNVSELESIGQLPQRETATSVEANDAAPQGQDVEAGNNDIMPFRDSQLLLMEAEDAMFANVSNRDVGKGLTTLMELSHSLQHRAPQSKSLFMKSGTLTSPPEVPADLNPSVAKSEITDPLVAAKAAFTLAALSSSGITSRWWSVNSAEQMVLLHRAAAVGSPEARLALAFRFLKAFDVEQNCEMGLKYAKEAAQNVTMEVEQASRFHAPIPSLSLRERWFDGNYKTPTDPNESEEVLHMEEDMALRGNPDAQRRMAYRRLLGRGMEADPEAAYNDFVAGAAAGDAYATFNVGYMHLKGIHVPQNYTVAHEHIKKSADMGLGAGYNALGILHWNGFHVPANLSAAFEAFKKGAELRNEDSLYNLGIMHMGGLATPVNITQGIECYKEALAAGHWKSAYTLALVYADGQGVERNCSAASHYFFRYFEDRSHWRDELRDAGDSLEAGDEWGALVRYALLAQQGSRAGAENAAWLLQQQYETQRDPYTLHMAVQMHTRAAAVGSPHSMIELGHVAAEGRGADAPDPQLAFSWYLRAAQEGSAEGMFYTAHAYLHGAGTDADYAAASAWYTKAFHAAGNSSAVVPVMVAMIGMRVDRVLAPLLGPHFTYRMMRHVQEAVIALTAQLMAPQEASSLELPAGKATSTRRVQADGGLSTSFLAGFNSMEGEDIALLVLVAMLIVVLTATRALFHRVFLR